MLLLSVKLELPSPKLPGGLLLGMVVVLHLHVP
jgi:hypothetical protein